MTVSVTDDCTLRGAINGQKALLKAYELLEEVERLVKVAEQECDYEVDMGGFEDLQCSVSMGFEETKEALANFDEEAPL